jgi:hypothetical protein
VPIALSQWLFSGWNDLNWFRIWNCWKRSAATDLIMTVVGGLLMAAWKLAIFQNNLSFDVNAKTPHKAGFLVVARPRLELGTEGL